mmetsp:Transcript_12496/g.29327  ORF Transcript_12496/g.29327 Transcript_12496/m.29327 type:complete len:273 (+) Transcript_12496:484-1302(+)
MRIPLLLSEGQARAAPRHAEPSSLRIGRSTCRRLVAADNVAVPAVVMQRLAWACARTRVEVAEVRETLPAQLRSRLHRDLVAQDAGDAKLARAGAHDLVVQVPHHAGEVRHVHVCVIKVLRAFGAVEVDGHLGLRRRAANRRFVARRRVAGRHVGWGHVAWRHVMRGHITRRHGRVKDVPEPGRQCWHLAFLGVLRAQCRTARLQKGQAASGTTRAAVVQFQRCLFLLANLGGGGGCQQKRWQEPTDQQHLWHVAVTGHFWQARTGQGWCSC